MSDYRELVERLRAYWDTESSCMADACDAAADAIERLMQAHAIDMGTNKVLLEQNERLTQERIAYRPDNRYVAEDARAAERERCARICDEAARLWNKKLASDYEQGRSEMADEIAAAIRKG